MNSHDLLLRLYALVTRHETCVLLVAMILLEYRHVSTATCLMEQPARLLVCGINGRNPKHVGR